ncbi:MAG: hypothetical protein M1827_001249 [Pycnora praestabilis]|nr:MAG: hypothetical protein M1827_001249 [Pycnora praestabilis]
MSMLGQVEGSRNSRIDGLADLDSPSPSKYYQNLLNSGTRDWEDAVTDDDGTGNCQIENLRIAAEIFQRHLSKPAYSALRRASDPGPNVSSSRRSSSQSKKRFKFPFRLKRRYSLPSILEIYYSVRSRYRKFKGRECNPEKQRLEELIEEAGEDLTFQSKYRDILEERLEELIEQIEEEYNAWESQCRSFLKALQDSISEDAPDYGVSAQLPGKGPSSGRGHIVHQFEEYKKFKRLVEAAQARETAGGFT